MGLEAGLVPGGAELAAAANVGQDEDAAAFKPEFADNAGVARSLRELEAAVGRHQRGVGAVVLDVFAVDDEIRDFGAVGWAGVQLFVEEVGGVELSGQSFCRVEGG